MAENKAVEQNARVRISGGLLARNALLNLIGQAVPLQGRDLTMICGT